MTAVSFDSSTSLVGDIGAPNRRPEGNRTADVERRQTMRQVVAVTQLPLDGVMQAPGGPKKTRAAASGPEVGRSRTSTRSSERRWKRPSRSRSSSCSAGGRTRSSPRTGPTPRADRRCLEQREEVRRLADA